MRYVNGKFRLSPTDLSHFAECKHIISLDMERLRGQEITLTQPDEFSQIISQRGIEHETRYLDYLRTTAPT